MFPGREGAGVSFKVNLDCLKLGCLPKINFLGFLEENKKFWLLRLPGRTLIFLTVGLKWHHRWGIHTYFFASLLFFFV